LFSVPSNPTKPALDFKHLHFLSGSLSDHILSFLELRRIANHCYTNIRGNICSLQYFKRIAKVPIGTASPAQNTGHNQRHSSAGFMIFPGFAAQSSAVVLRSSNGPADVFLFSRFLVQALEKICKILSAMNDALSSAVIFCVSTTISGDRGSS